MRTPGFVRALLALSFAVAAGAACSGGSDDSFKVDDLCSPNNGGFIVLVDKLVECTPELELFLGELPSDTDIGNACTAQFEGFVEDGTIELQDKARLQACLDAIAAADCLTFELGNVDECEDLVAGTLAPDSACETKDQCEGDAYCDESADGTCGVCRPTLADGETCTDNDECTSGKCRSNGACGPFGAEGSPCDDTEDCVGQLICDVTCQVPVDSQVGDACTAFAQCGFPFSDLYCDEQAGTCEQFLSVGDDCFDGAAALGVCDLIAYETCDFADTRKCISPTIVAIGEACAFQDGRKCADGLICSGGDNGVCREQGLGAECDVTAEGNSCGLFLECQDNNLCDYENAYSGMCPAA